VTGASLLLMLYAIFAGDKKLEPSYFSFEHLFIGIVSGIVLYSLFFIGFTIFKPLVSDGAVNVYRFRKEISLIIPSILLPFTSFCEEFFWRAFVQKNLFRDYGIYGMLITSILYALIHLPTLNLPLVFAALIAGLFWGVLYVYTDSLWIVVFSHMVWTEFIFVFLPLK
jgi:membrane protease YdiL (CAAX protease family)